MAMQTDCTICGDDPQATYVTGLEVNLESWADAVDEAKAAYYADMGSNKKWAKWDRALKAWFACLTLRAAENGKPLPAARNHFERSLLFNRLNTPKAKAA